MRIDPAFKKQSHHIDFDFLSKSNDVVYVLDNALKIMAYNDAWITFAKSNNGEDIITRFPLGTAISEVCKEPLGIYIVNAYAQAILKNIPFAHRYECSSAQTYRVFYQTAYPIFNSKGLIITNHLIVGKPHSEEGVAFSSRFENEAGMVTQCSNCRKIRNPYNKRQWYWVPELVENPLPNTSHSICTPCLDHYFPDIEDV